RAGQHASPQAVLAVAARARGAIGAGPSPRMRHLSSRVRRGICTCRSLLLIAMLAAPARGQGGVLLQGLLELEGWKTDTSSNLLSRNQGDPAGSFRLRMWSAVEPARGLFVYAHGVFEGGSALRFDGPDPSTALEQAGVRLARHRALVLEA